MRGVMLRPIVTLLAFLAWVGCESSDPALVNPVSGGSSAVAGSAVPPSGAAAGAGARSSITSGSTAAGRSAAAAGVTASAAGTGVAGVSGLAGVGAESVAGASSVASGSGASGAGAAGMALAGIGGTAGTAGTAQAGALSAGSAAVPREDLGKGDGSDVIAFGDSWMLLGLTGIQLSLVRLSGQPYRTYGVPGTRLLDGVIPNQYASAKRANPDIKTVVMTGGGNDILLTGAGNDRATAGPNTRMQIDKVADRLTMLWAEMGMDGVKDIVYIEYSRGGSNEAAVNYATEKIKPLCEAVAPARCHWVDSDEYIMGVLGDGIHPTGDGCDKIAKGIIAMMEEEGMRR